MIERDMSRHTQEKRNEVVLSRGFAGLLSAIGNYS